MRGVLAQFSPSIAAWQTVFSARTAHSTRSSQIEPAAGSQREDEEGTMPEVAALEKALKESASPGPDTYICLAGKCLALTCRWRSRPQHQNRTCRV
jgi:hypothetical protein